MLISFFFYGFFFFTNERIRSTTFPCIFLYHIPKTCAPLLNFDLKAVLPCSGGGVAVVVVVVAVIIEEEDKTMEGER